MTGATNTQLAQEFVSIASNWLASLPYDIKVLYDAKDDEHLDRDVRETATSALIYIVSPRDAIADSRQDTFANFFDDCLVFHLALHAINESQGEDASLFVEKYPEHFDTLTEELKVCREVMGDLFQWIESKLAAMAKQKYKGKNVAQFLDSEDASELLYDDGLEFRTEYPVDEDALQDKLKKPDTVLEIMRRRKSLEDRKA